MKSLWDDNEARQFTDDLGMRVYTSRLLGRDKSLVLHGGGNTSVKISEKNILGEEETLLYVKGSGWDLETIGREGFSPVRMQHLIELSKLDVLSDPQMVNELKTHMTQAAAPAPSVETILHAILPHKYVDHTHADALITITNSPDSHARIKQIYGSSVVVIPYVMPGFDLAKLCGDRFHAEYSDNTIGMVLMNHGIFSFADTAQKSYERMITLVSQAEAYLKQQGAWEISKTEAPDNEGVLRHELAKLRQEISAAAGFPVVLNSLRDAQSLTFIQRDDITDISQQGPATPDHVIRTKRLPLVGRNVTEYVEAYKAYFTEHNAKSQQGKTMLDPAPRVVLDRELGMCSVGCTAKDAYIARDIYQHTMDIISRAAALGGFCALSGQQIFDVEYWDLEQAKLRKEDKPPVFNGEVALVTGAASGIGRACVESLLLRGAAVIGLDINPEIETVHARQDYLGIVCDITDEQQIITALEIGVQAFGGLDMLILNAGIFPSGCRIDMLQTSQWRKVMEINLDANLVLMREGHALLKRAPLGGRVVVIGSKNVAAPGPGAAAYSASKAALNQLSRIAALEWGQDNIRINSLHPNAVFDTGLWTDEVLQSRAKAYGLNVEEYKRRNIMKVEIYSQDVAELAAEMCGPLFAKTTAAQISVDGGDERVI